MEAILQRDLRRAPAIALELGHNPERAAAPTTPRRHSATAGTRRDLSGTYAQLLGAALFVNLGLLGVCVSSGTLSNPNVPACLATINIFVAILVRNEIFLNGLYRVLVKAGSPATVPVDVKNGVTSGLLHIGGIHAGCAAASVVWLAVGLLHPASSPALNRPWLAVVFCGGIVLLLSVMCVVSLPSIRDRHHDVFEMTHRFLGWSSLLLLWGYALLSVNWTSEASSWFTPSARNVSVWLTVAITALIVSPWLTVRKVRVEARVASPSIVEITFPGTTRPGSFGRISRGALADWHAFAVVSGKALGDSHMMVISGVGDFTRALIASPPTALYTRTRKFAGLPSCVPMYQRSIIIATGAGMAPYLSLLPTLPRGQHRFIWIGRSFRDYFGDRLYELALEWPDMVLVDTTTRGRPDMTALAVEQYRDFGAEAVFVGSNPEGTRHIVDGCRARGIPAFGPSWDS